MHDPSEQKLGSSFIFSGYVLGAVDNAPDTVFHQRHQALHFPRTGVIAIQRYNTYSPGFRYHCSKLQTTDYSLSVILKTEGSATCSSCVRDFEIRLVQRRFQHFKRDFQISAGISGFHKHLLGFLITGKHFVRFQAQFCEISGFP